MSANVNPKPHEAHERAVVACMLLHPELVPELVDVVAEQDFASSRLRAAYRGIVALHERGEPVEVLTLEAELSRSRELALVGGLVGLGELTSDARWGPAQHHLHHARQVRTYAAVRELGTKASEIAEDCRALKSDPRTLLDRASEAIAPSLAVDAELETMSAIVHRTFAGIVRRRDGLTGVLTGIHDMDNLMLGMDPGTLHVVGARPGMGKTAFYTSMARWNARQGIPAGFLSVEMSTAQVTERYLTADAGVDNQRVRAGTCDAREMAALVRAADRLVRSPMEIMGDLVAPTMPQIRARARAWRRRHATADKCVLGIDYLGLVHGDGDTAEERIASVSRGCKELAKELRCPIVLLAQLNRGVEARSGGRPRMSDLRGSGAIEQDADSILFIHRGAQGDDDSMPKDAADLILEKHRHGPTGTIRCRYIGPRTLFCNRPREGVRDEDEGP